MDTRHIDMALTLFKSAVAVCTNGKSIFATFPDRFKEQSRHAVKQGFLVIARFNDAPDCPVILRRYGWSLS